jgi:signal transduction histidine kinase
MPSPRLLLAFILFSLSLFAPSFAETQLPAPLAAKPVVLTNSDAAVPVGKYAMVLENVQRSLTAEEAHSLPSVFMPIKGAIVNYGFTNSAIWVRFSVLNPSGERCFLQVYNAPLDTLDVYIPRKDGTFFHKRYGSDILGSREFSSTYPVIALEELDSATTEPVTVYVRAVSFGVMYLPYEIAGTQAVIRSSLYYSWFNAISFTVLIVLVVYNFFIFLSVRQMSYLLYVLYGLAIALFFSYQKGYVFLLFGDEFACWMYSIPAMPNILVSLPATLICLFAAAFLHTHEILPKMHKALMVIVVLFAFNIALESLTGIGLARKTLSFLVMIASVTTLISGIMALRKGYAPARYYLIGWGTWLVATILYAMMVERLLPTTRFIEIVLQLGASSEAVLMSFALGDRINLLRKTLSTERQQRAISERERELEHVRYNELEEANAYIKKQRDEINDYTLNIEAANLELHQINDRLTTQQTLLEQRATEIETMNNQLQHQNNQLHTLNEEKNEFLGIAAHDLKNPLTGLRGMLEILDTDDDLPRDYRNKMLTVMRHSVERMFEIVSKFLDVNAIEQGMIIPNSESFVLMPLAQSVVGNYALPAADKHIRINVSGDENAECHADKHLVLQVLDNLISNAVKYSPFGASVRVQVRTELPEQFLVQSPHENVRESYQRHTFLTVQDAGPGITAEDHEKLFRKFARLSAKPTGGEHSTGLGLSIAKRLMDAMLGYIWCVSEPNKGATFIIALPLRTD